MKLLLQVETFFPPLKISNYNLDLLSFLFKIIRVSQW